MEHTKQRTILIVDDMPHNLKALMAFLEMSDFQIIVAQSGEVAVERAQHTLPDIILLDVLMPDMDGFETCRRLKAHEATKHIPVIFMTALSETVEKVKGFRLGGVDYITKPVQHEEVLARITAHLTIRDLQQQLQAQNTRLQANNAQLQSEIATRKQAEEAVKTSEERYRAVVEDQTELICRFLPDGSLTFVNQSYCRYFGKIQEALLGQSFFQYIPEEDYGMLKNQLADLSREQPVCVIEHRAFRPDGETRWQRWTDRIIIDEHGHVQEFQAVGQDITGYKQVEDELEQYHKNLYELVEERTIELTRSNTQLQQEITERKRVESALRKSEQQYRLLAENVADGIGILQEGTWIFVNRALAAMLGDTTDRFLRQAPDVLFHDTYAQRFNEWYEEMQHTVSGNPFQGICLSRDGRDVWTEWYPSRIVWQGTSALLVSVRDITAGKQRELAVQQEKTQLERENVTLRATIQDRYKFGAIIGKSRAMQDVYQSIVKASASDANVVVYGESGTGKELVARTIHQLSARKGQTFVAVNCGAIPESLFEREFFGHRKGAFTGATMDKPGYFDKAHRGTLFLDEIGELTLGMQVKLLRVLQDGEYTPLGDTNSKQADVRVIAATNKDLRDLLHKGLFREDFFYRIRVIVITLPPLRDRKEDIPLLIEHFLSQYVKGNDRRAISARTVEMLNAYAWPGNVRELQNELQRYLAEQRLEFIGYASVEPAEQTRGIDPGFDPAGTSFHEAVESFEKRLIVDVLTQNAWHQGKTAAILGIPSRTLYNKMKKYRLKNTNG